MVELSTVRWWQREVLYCIGIVWSRAGNVMLGGAAALWGYVEIWRGLVQSWQGGVLYCFGTRRVLFRSGRVR